MSDEQVIIDKLEEVIAMVRAGTVASISLAVVGRQDDFDIFFGGSDALKLIGATAFLHQRLTEQLVVALPTQEATRRVRKCP